MKTNKKDIDEKFGTFDSYAEEDAQKVMDNQEKIEKIASNDTHKYRLILNFISRCWEMFSL